MRLHCRKMAFSLMELLIVMAMISILGGILFVATAGARERGRQAVCISNLRQIGQAITMYRMDVGGHDPDGTALTPEQVGLPWSPHAPLALAPYVRNHDIWICSDDAFPSRNRASDYTSYAYNWIRDNPPDLYKRWMRQVAYYEMRVPLFADQNHERPMDIRYNVVLRLDGTVKGEILNTFDDFAIPK